MPNTEAKRGRGRPPERTETVWVRLTPEDKAFWEAEAARLGLSVSRRIAASLSATRSAIEGT